MRRDDSRGSLRARASFLVEGDSLSLPETRATAERVHLKDSDLLSEGVALAKEKPTAGKFIPAGKWGGDDGSGDHGDLGTGANMYNSGNFYDIESPGDDGRT